MLLLRARLFLLAVPLVGAGCGPPAWSPPAAATLRPVAAASVGPRVRASQPPQHVQYRFSFKLRVDGSTSGRGIVLAAPPDSLMLDFRGPLGFGTGQAAVVGDSALWADPADKIDQFVPSYPLLWAMVGVIRPPPAGWQVSSLTDARGDTWSYTSGADTVVYTLTRSRATTLHALVVRAGKRVGKVATDLYADGRPRTSRLDVLLSPARLDLTFDSINKPATFDRSAWLAPHDQ